MIWVGLGLTHLITIALGVLAFALWRKLRAAQHDLREAKRLEVLALHHLDRLIRHFHLQDSESPYVVEKMGSGGTVSEADIRCWHCKNLRAEGHRPACPWEYVNRAVKYAADGTPHLR
jgi:hypothetical protein